MTQCTQQHVELKEEIRAKALELGFDQVGFAPPKPPPHHEKLPQWLAQEGAGDMAWLANNQARRMDPNTLMQGLACILVVGVNYQPVEDLEQQLGQVDEGYISAYARGRDYHELMKKKLKALGRWLQERLGGEHEGRVFVDTAPVLERPMAALSGVGWQGKNTMLVSRQFGCWMFLGEFFLSLPLLPDRVEQDHCGSCNRCQVACPTGALERPYWLLAPDCLAYWSIETDLPIPHAMRRAMGNRIYGCDDCVRVCPFNRFGEPTQQSHYQTPEHRQHLKLVDLVALDDAQFRQLFRQSPVKRSGVMRLQRNVAVALGNWRSEEAVEPLIRLLGHAHPIVRGHAVWGLGEHKKTPSAMAALSVFAEQETDHYVCEELARLNLAQ
uniref:4Fe-4S ferredoxin-type domain-containing protein n=1 Tax=Magnetococcus massalia (strain MO-1) TaxID=451514 RepID=A0A1S7LH83_MAGMO|nr:Conserved protein of unknown function. Putative Fe-S electron transport protein [Candidatus Magnetococcus massalia]